MTVRHSQLAIHGGPKGLAKVPPAELFHWPIVTRQDEEAVLEVLRAGTMSGTEITRAFADEFAAWNGRSLALAYPNGTEALRAAMWALELGAGDELICPSMTYWASCTQALSLGATVNFADIETDTLCIDPGDIEHRIGPRTKAIMAVHYAGHPCNMDAITEIARRHDIKVIEDVSHAHGSLYKGRKVGTFGDIAAMSMMAGKSFAIGEGGMLITDDSTCYERCIAYGHYERTGVRTEWADVAGDTILEELAPFRGVPLGGFKHRLNQTCAAMGRIQLRYYDERIAEIQRAMNRFWDLLDGVPGLIAHRPAKDSGSTMGGWYSAIGLYRADDLGGLSCSSYCEAVEAEGVAGCSPGANFPLHLHEVFHTADIFRMGKPTVVAFGQRDVRQGRGSLPVAERINEIAFSIPWFKRDLPAFIEAYAAVFRKVAEQADALVG
jgi:dTDP-4-amino-4,6-dideoxygalactose transaminase